MTDVITLLVKALLGTIFLAFAGVFLGLLYKGIDRKLVARLQSRIGPPVQQPFYDVQKLLIKQNIVPQNAVEWLFHGAPILSFASAIAILLYLPLFGQPAVLDGYGDIILVLYLLTLPSLGMILGGFASSSPYATVGSQREMVMVMSYEFPLAIAVSTIAWRLSMMDGGLDVFSISTIAQNPLWNELGALGIIGFLMIFITVMAVVPAKLVKIPFDAPEAETEICGGLLVEYSGTNFALFYLADAVRTLAVGGLVIALFIPYGITDMVDLGVSMNFTLLGSEIEVFGAILDSLFFLVKLFVVVFVGVTVVRAATARLKIDQVTGLYWGYLTFMALIGLGLVVIDYSL